MNIVVLAGGLSTERDVSFITGNMVSQALRKNGHAALLLDVFLGYEKPISNIEDVFAHAEENSLQVNMIPETAPDLEKVKSMRTDDGKSFFGPNVLELCKYADIVFMALHGENGENGKIQAAFDLFGIKYTGTGYLSSALAMDKGLTKTMFLTAGIPTPRAVTMKKNEYAKEFFQTGLTLPCVVKPCCGGSSIGVSIVRDAAEFDAALTEAFRFEDEVIIEEFIQGREFSVGVVDGEAYPVIEIAPVEGFYDYKNKYKAGSAIETCPADLPENVTREMKIHAKEAAQVLGLDTYSRMDFILGEDGGIYCLEANTLPGMTPTSLLPQEARAIGIGFEELCEKLLHISMAKYEN